ncbi:hypothetical protein F0562_026182 [Nyssa sinensis]|uniref:Uncharacterized protein n=1 Tax=Nyssa sinensis TaxID=561372 RepID=A0A5J5BAI6_9ASTE|nr:hypothetical protein F0562_026182 [Nyssa sinensis]
MWMKSRHILNSHFQSSMNSFSSSWEEQAFAKDAAGPHGGSIVASQEHQKEIPSSSPPSCSDSDSEPVTLGISDSKNRCEKNTREEETTIFLSRDDYIETNLSVGLNLVLSQNIPMGSAGDDAVSYKRYKTSVPSSQFFLKRSSMEDLDLELRLGDPPKVK